jgi:hypothetical protein
LWPHGESPSRRTSSQLAPAMKTERVNTTSIVGTAPASLTKRLIKLKNSALAAM